MKPPKKIFYSLLVIATALILASMCMEAASSTSIYTVEGRRTALTWFFIVLIVGLLSVIVIWLPWKKWLNKK